MCVEPSRRAIDQGKIACTQCLPLHVIPTVIAIQGCLLSESSADMELTQDFLSQFSKVLGSRWPLLASLHSFSTAEIEDIKRGVTGVPSIKAAAMLSKWREKQSPTPTYGLLKCKVTVASHVRTHEVCSNFAALYWQSPRLCACCCTEGSYECSTIRV